MIQDKKGPELLLQSAEQEKQQFKDINTHK